MGDTDLGDPQTTMRRLLTSGELGALAAFTRAGTRKCPESVYAWAPDADACRLAGIISLQRRYFRAQPVDFFRRGERVGGGNVGLELHQRCGTLCSGAVGRRLANV